METKDIILELRTKHGLSQEELAEKVFVTRQAVSRWENGETVPNTETLKLLSKLFDVSIILSSALRGNLFVNAAVCRWKTIISAVRKTGSSTKIIASGAMPTASICITIWTI